MTLRERVGQALDRTLLLGAGLMPSRGLARLFRFAAENPRVGDRAEYHVRPIHFYEPLPDFRHLTIGRVTRRRQSPAVDWNTSEQIDWLHKLACCREELTAVHRSAGTALGFDFSNPLFGPLDAAVYYATVRTLRPRHIIEIGSGYSTQIACLALQRNAAQGAFGTMTCIDPYPAAWLHGAGMKIEIVPEPVETLSLERFRALQSGDILFIDSTHTVKFQSDVVREFLEILPELAGGVYVHVHDIFFPYDYPPDWLIQQRRAWNEQYLVEAFLAYNHEFEVVLANHLMAVDYSYVSNAVLPDALRCDSWLYNAGSFWMRRKDH